ncbi:MAG: glycosyltransferase family 2 protein [Acidimicrobiales bacterium]
MTVTEVVITLVLFAPAILLALSEMSPNLRASRHATAHVDADSRRIENFTVIVPIYGHIRYLTNVDYLRQYGERVLITTTTAETDEFNAAIEEICAREGFRLFRGHVPGRAVGGSSGGKKSTGGVVREIIVRDALAVVEHPYVVCIDADTETALPLSILVGALEEHAFDVASIRLEAQNQDNLIERLQAHEYRTAMRLRVLMPWLVSGACHVLRTRVHREIMHAHSTFFQGNDVEVGVLGDALQYRVGHIPFVVPTIVPSTFKAWWRQRLAWSGGETRLFVVNLYLARWHPTLFLYGFLALVTTPLRWYYLINPSWPVVAAVTTYLVTMAWVNRRSFDRALLVMPLYLLFISLVIVPLGPITYARMAWADRKMGVIRRQELRQRPFVPDAGLVRPL